MQSPRKYPFFEAEHQAAHCTLGAYRSLGAHYTAADVEVALIAAAGAGPEAKLDPPMDWSSAGLGFGGLATLADSSSGSTCWCVFADLVLVILEYLMLAVCCLSMPPSCG